MEGQNENEGDAQLVVLTLDQLRQFDGSDPQKPIFVAIKGVIYDVSASLTFYGAGGPYSVFAGRDITRALALMSLNDGDLNSDLNGLDESEIETLEDWEAKFISKYDKKGSKEVDVVVASGRGWSPTYDAQRNGASKSTWRPHATALSIYVALVCCLLEHGICHQALICVTCRLGRVCIWFSLAGCSQGSERDGEFVSARTYDTLDNEE